METPDRMRAMVLDSPRSPLRLRFLPIAEPGPEEILVKVHACAVCRTDLHVVDGELPEPKQPLIPGHQVSGVAWRVGQRVPDVRPGDRVGVPWLGWTCGTCEFCLKGKENLCDRARFTGYTLDGGFAEFLVAHEKYCLPLPAGSPEDIAVAPLLCAGLIGYRSYGMIRGEAGRLGIYGFGAAAHIIAQVAIHEGCSVYAFTTPGDREAQDFARGLGAVWAGDSTAAPPDRLDAAIIFAPVGSLVPAALRAVVKGGTVVCGGIHMSEIPAFPYEILWGERCVRSVANLTRRDGVEFLELAARAAVRTRPTPYPLEQAELALDDLRRGRLQGSAVLVLGR